MKKLGALFFAVCSLAIGSCDLIPEPDYVADMLMPLVKTNIKVENISEISDKEFIWEFTLPDVSHIISDPTVPVPAISNQNVGPLPITDVTDAFERARVDTAEFQLTIINNFPINIKAGTRVEISNTSNSEIVFAVPLTEDIAANGGSQVVTVFLSSTSPWIDNDLQISLRNFGTSGSTTPVTFGPNSGIKLKFKIKIFRINEIEIRQGKSYYLNDTVDFQFYDEDNTGNLAEGKLTLFVRNGFPAGYEFQSYFLDENYQIVDSLLLDNSIPAPEIDAQGLAIESSVQERKLVTAWTREGIIRLRDRAKYMNIKARFAVPTSAALPANAPVRLRHENQVPLQLVADLKVEVTP